MNDPNFCVAQVRLLNRRAWNARWRCRKASVGAASQVLDLAQACPTKTDTSDVGYAMRTLAWQAKWRGDFDEAMAHAVAAEQNLQEKKHPLARGDLYSILGVIHYSRARLDLAAGAVERGFQILPRHPGTDDIPTRIDLLTTHSSIQCYSGQLAHANVTLGAALDLAEREELARVEQNVARCVLADEDAETALEHANRSVALCESTANNVVLPYALEVQGECLFRIGLLDDAEAAFAKGLEVGLVDNDRRVQCQILLKYGHLELKRGDARKAVDLLKHGASIAGRMTYGLWGRDLERGLATAYEVLGEMDAAVDAHKRAWAEMDEWRN